jgi:hypothetical protein
VEVARVISGGRVRLCWLLHCMHWTLDEAQRDGHDADVSPSSTTIVKGLLVIEWGDASRAPFLAMRQKPRKLDDILGGKSYACSRCYLVFRHPPAVPVLPVLPSRRYHCASTGPAGAAPTSTKVPPGT